MGEEIAYENGRISDFQGLVTLTLDRVILHTGMHQSSTSTYKPNFIKIEETFCGRTDVRTFENHFISSTRTSRPKNNTSIGDQTHNSPILLKHRHGCFCHHILEARCDLDLWSQNL